MGHSSVTTTEVYSDKRVAQDFPTLVQNYVNNAKIEKVDTKNGGHTFYTHMGVWDFK